MKFTHLFVAAAASAMLLGSAASATSVLYRIDDTIATDRMGSALAALGYTVTTTSGSIAGFTLSDYDLVIYANQNFSIDGSEIDLLEMHVSNGGRLIFNDWLTGAPSNLGGGYTGNSNESEVTVGPLFSAGLTNPLTLTNPGWGIFSTGLSATSATVAGTFGSGEAAILVGNGGRTIWNGFLYDTLDSDQLLINQLTYITGDGGVVPEPATWGLMIAGFGLVGFAARRRRTLAAA